MAARFSLPSLRGISRARWVAIALATGGECIVSYKGNNTCCVYQACGTSNVPLTFLRVPCTAAGYVGVVILRWRRRYREYRARESGE